jgi:hypothetical protein
MSGTNCPRVRVPTLVLHRVDGFFSSFDGPARAIRCAQAHLPSLREAQLREVPAISAPPNMTCHSTTG